jgi:hypothetical protein
MLTDEQRSDLTWVLEVADSANRGGKKTIERLRLWLGLASAAPADGWEKCPQCGMSEPGEAWLCPRSTNQSAPCARAAATPHEEIDALIQAYGEACHRSSSATEMNEKRKAILRAFQRALATAPTMGDAVHGLRVTRAEIDLIVSDPMWADHAEVSKRALRRWRDAIDRAAAKEQP